MPRKSSVRTVTTIGIDMGKTTLHDFFDSIDPTRTWDLGQGEISFAQILAGPQAKPHDYWRWCLRERHLPREL